MRIVQKSSESLTNDVNYNLGIVKAPGMEKKGSMESSKVLKEVYELAKNL